MKKFHLDRKQVDHRGLWCATKHETRLRHEDRVVADYRLCTCVECLRSYLAAIKGDTYTAQNGSD